MTFKCRHHQPIPRRHPHPKDPDVQALATLLHSAYTDACIALEGFERAEEGLGGDVWVDLSDPERSAPHYFANSFASALHLGLRSIDRINLKASNILAAEATAFSQAFAAVVGIRNSHEHSDERMVSESRGKKIAGPITLSDLNRGVLRTTDAKGNRQTLAIDLANLNRFREIVVQALQRL